MKNNISRPFDFYDNISGFYDEMISFDSALENRKAVIKNLIRPGMKTAADLGCGSGLDSISLALAGSDVTAFDISVGMIEIAKKNSLSMGVKINYVLCSIDKISNEYYSQFDIAVSLGNTLANLDPKTLDTALKKIHKILKKDGMLLIQLLNYELIRKKNKRIVKISKGKDETIIRFYDIFADKFNFNILKINNDAPAKYELNTTAIYPYTRKLIKKMLKNTGFKKSKFYGSLKPEKFEESKSGDLVVIAHK